MSDTERCAELAERLLDGELDAAAWAEARATHGPALDAALTAVKERRDVLAALPRPILPGGLRERLLAVPRSAAVPGPGGANPHIIPNIKSPRRLYWRLAIPASLAAMVVVMILIGRNRSVDAHEASARTVTMHGDALKKEPALQEAGNSGRPADKSDMASSPSQAVAAAEKTPQAPPAAMSKSAPVAAKPAAEAPLTLSVAAMWRSEAAKRADTIREVGGNNDGLAEAKAVRKSRQALAPEPADPEDPTLRITLRNQGSQELRLPAGSIRLAGISKSGRTVWQTVIHGDRETVIPPSGTVTWDEPVPVIPPGAAHLRVEARGVHSADLAP